MRVLSIGLVAIAVGCSGSEPSVAPGSDDAAPADTNLAPADGSGSDTPTEADTGAADTDAPDDAAGDPPIAVDTSDPKRHTFTFKANEADPAAKESLGTQGAYLDTRATPKGKLVVYLHGAGSSAPTSCTQGELANVLAPMGFHLLTPCYDSYYGVGNCKDDIGGCRLEAFEGVDHTKVIDVKPADAIEPRIVAALKFLATKHPGGDWTYFLEGDKPRWSKIVIAGISHGASSAGIIGMVRKVDRVVMLSGPLDSKQAWLEKTPVTEIDRFFGFTHTADSQHAGHLAAFETMGLPGAVTSVDDASPPYGGSHRLKTSAPSSNGHSSTQPGSASPKSGGAYVFLPVWKYLFGG